MPEFVQSPQTIVGRGPAGEGEGRGRGKREDESNAVPELLGPRDGGRVEGREGFFSRLVLSKDSLPGLGVAVGWVVCSRHSDVEDLTIEWRRQILQSEAESQRIAVRKLLNRLQHPGWYVSRLQTIRCGHTACGGYGHLGGLRRLYPTQPSSPCMG